MENWIIGIYVYFWISTFITEMTAERPEGTKYSFPVRILGYMVFSAFWPFLIGVKFISYIRSL
jgi:hypothetical protein